jgi:phage terminase large subunit-like protein
VGRRAGKSFMAAVIAVYLAIFFDYRKQLSVGERGVIQIIAADKAQAGVIFNYIKGIIQETTFFKQFIEREYTDKLD